MIDPYSHIDDYINGRLSDADQTAFEALLANDSDLRLAVDNHDVAMDIVGSLIEDEVRGVLGETASSLEVESQNTQNSKAKIVRFNWKRLIAAASLVFVLGITYQLTSNYSQKQEYAARYIESKSDYIEPAYDISRGKAEINTIDYARKQFQLGNYAESRTSFEKVSKSKNADQNEINFYLAHILYHQKDYSGSKSKLESITTDSVWDTRIENLEQILNYILDGKT